MKLTDIDLSSLRYDPSDKKEIKRLQTDYPGQFECVIYENQKDLIPQHENILKYIILVYDMNSPLRKSLKTHNECKVQGMLMAGFEPDSRGRFDKAIEQALIYGQDSGVASMIVKYVYIFNNVDYSELIGMLELNSQLLMAIQNHKTNNNTFKDLSNTSARIKELTAVIFGGKETKEIEEQLYEQLSMNRLSLRPENIAKQLSEGNAHGIFSSDPYGVYKDKKSERKKKYGDLQL